jgi:hypothetical protein
MTDTSPFLGHMVNFATWERFIRASMGSDDMKDAIIEYVKAHVPREGELVDSFKLGLAVGEFSNRLQTAAAIDDWLRTIVLTRSLDNVPIVQVNGVPVS